MLFLSDYHCKVIEVAFEMWGGEENHIIMVFSCSMNTKECSY